MNSAQRQALIIDNMKNLKVKYSQIKATIKKIQENKKKIEKKKRKMAKAAALDPSQAANGSSMSK